MSQVNRLAKGGRIDRSQPLSFTFNGQTYQGYAGDSLAAALLAERAGDRRSDAAAAWPTLLRKSRPVCGLSAPLSLLTPSGASIFRISSATGCCGATFCVTSNGCEKFSGEIVPGVTNTRAPIRVQLYILTANDIGMRMQPWEAG